MVFADALIQSPSLLVDYTDLIDCSTTKLVGRPARAFCITCWVAGCGAVGRIFIVAEPRVIIAFRCS